MLSKRPVSLIFTLLWCLLLSGITMGQYHFDRWTTDNGLPQNGIRQITQTPDGYLWFTTFDGLVRFDGVRFTTFNKSNTKGIINNRFTGIFADVDGTIYATTMEDGILTINRKGIFNSFTSEQVPGHYIISIERDENGQLRFLCEDDDRKDKSWYRLEGDRFEFIEKQPETNTNTKFKGKSGTVWTLTPSGLTESRDGKEYFIPLDLSRLSFDANMFEDRDGNLWIGENQVYRIRHGEMKIFGEAEGLPRSSLYHSFWQEADGSIWFSSGGSNSQSIGLVQIKTDDHISTWGAEHGLASSTIQSVFVDREGTPWLATEKGLARRRKQIIQSFSTKDGIDNTEIYPILRDRKNTIWIGSVKGLTRYKDGKFEPVVLQPSKDDAPNRLSWRQNQMSVQSLYEDADGKIWVGLNGGIHIVSDGVAKLLYAGSHVFAINSDRHGNVWAATNKGLLRFSDGQVVELFDKSSGLPNDFMTTVFEDSKGEMWFGGYGGLTKYENGAFVNYTTREGLVGNYVRTIYQDSDGVIWVGTYDQGLSRFKDGKFTNYGEAEGLYNSGVFAIREDTKGFFWISSNRGIYRVSRQELNDFAEKRIKRINSVGYGKEDGMLNNECNGGRQPSSLVDDQGRFWFPTQDGVSIVDPAAESVNPLAPTVVVEEILADRQPIDVLNSATFMPGIRDIEIKYTGVSLIKSDQVRFQYKLDGHDADWVEAGQRRTAYYSYLPPGEYKFLIRAANSDGVWNEKGVAMNMSLKPFFYQTKLFLVLAVVLAAIILFLIWKISVHQLESRERKLTRLVAARTAELDEANKILQDLANSDGLTKIGNRRRFESFLADEWHRAVRFKTPISLVLLDIDHFKLFNDSYGHQAGDECLQMVANSLSNVVKRPTDLVTRFGGEEFAIVLGGTDAAGAKQVAEQVKKAISMLMIEHRCSETSELLTVSIGVSTLRPIRNEVESELIRIADHALYQAKASGRDQIYQAGDVSDGIVPIPVIVSEHLDIRPS